MSCQGQRLDICITQGKTFSWVLRWASEPYVYKPIEEVMNSAPLRLKVPNHGLPDGWMFAISAVGGMVEINASSNPPIAEDYYEASVVDPNHIEVNKLNGFLFSPYTAGGVIQYLTPVSLVGMSARMSIKDRIGGTTILHLTSDNGDITLDPVLHTIATRIAPTASELIQQKKGVYDLELFNNIDVFPLTYGSVAVHREVTTNG